MSRAAGTPWAAPASSSSASTPSRRASPTSSRASEHGRWPWRRSSHVRRHAGHRRRIAVTCSLSGPDAILIGTLAAFMMLNCCFWSPSASIPNVQNVAALFDQVFRDLDLPIDIDEVADVVSLVASRWRGRVRGCVVRRRRYRTLQNVSFVAEPVLLSRSWARPACRPTPGIPGGAGLYDFTSGAIRIDGTDIVILPSSSSQHRGLLQETHLFDGTVRENLESAKPCATWR